MNRTIDNRTQLLGESTDVTKGHRKHVLNPALYLPVILGNVSELIKKCEAQQMEFPRTAMVFLGILREHSSRHPNLEDWLLIPVYLFLWSQDDGKLRWFENQFVELVRGIGESDWSVLIDEVIQQTDCETTHRLCDRIYDYFLHMFGALYLIRLGWNVHVLSMRTPGPDIEARRNTDSCVMECTFKHTSKKIESLFWRFDFACRIFLPKKPMLYSAQFSFPNEKNMKELSLAHVRATKEFISKVYQDPQEIHVGTYEDLKFEYNPTLPLGTRIDLQHDIASCLAQDFFLGNMSKLLERKAKQLKVSENSVCQRILFLGLQSDSLYSMPWTDSVMKQNKQKLVSTALDDHGIQLIFSDEVGFDVERYL